jgi:hypothetical protein
MVLQRDLDAHECYVAHRNIVKEMVGSSAEYVTAVCFDPLEPWVSLVRNRFPYRGCEDRHWLLWVHPKYERFWTPRRVRWVVGKRFHVWENEVATKSIPEVLHHHIVPAPPLQPRDAGCLCPPTLYAQYS